jgi:hypothetical protein
MGRKQRPLELGPLARAGRPVDKKLEQSPTSLCKSALLERSRPLVHCLHLTPPSRGSAG